MEQGPDDHQEPGILAVENRLDGAARPVDCFLLQLR
jgi:hypothetical protein